MSGEEGAETTLEFTPTWVVAAVCTVIVAISLAVERLLHYAGKFLKSHNQKPLYEALQKVKEELMLLGFISLLLTVFQVPISKICVPPQLMTHLLPCSLSDKPGSEESSSSSNETTSHFQSSFSVSSSSSSSSSIPRTVRLLAETTTAEASEAATCASKHSFFKQFYAAVTKPDYATLRLGFIMTHCKSNPKFNFHKYMLRALEDDFKKVVGISWYLWIFVVIFLLLNVNGWHTYFWIAFIPFILLLAVGTKLEHVISQLAHEVAEKHIAIEGELVVQPSDEHFWFAKPRIVLFLIHFILFQNAFEIAFFFWIWVQYGFDSCIMGKVRYIVPRLIIGVFIQVLCSYSTLPLYAIVTQMGTSFKKAIFDEHVQAGLMGWAEKVRKKKGLKSGGDGSAQPSSHGSVGIQLGRIAKRASAPEEIQAAPASVDPK